MSAAPIVTATAPARQRIPLALLDRMESSRTLDEDNVIRLQSSIGKWGLMQSPVAIASGSRFLLCVGNHRCEALRRNGEVDVDCLVLPEGTSREEALIRSLHENHVRRDECLPDVMKRIKALMDFHGCKSFAEGAKLAGISESKVSKIRFAIDKLSPEAKAVIQQHKVGCSIAYEVARHASSPQEQAVWLQSHVRGELSRDAIVEQVRHRAKTAKHANRAAVVAKQPPVRLRGTVGGVVLQLTIKRDSSGESVLQALAAVARRLSEHVKAASPLSEFAITEK